MLGTLKLATNSTTTNIMIVRGIKVGREKTVDFGSCRHGGEELGKTVDVTFAAGH